ncbi:MAG: M18 family aminopeptidase [Methylococcaceae bacterium]|nr:M18 family aminopeptidase [Methylococcaceae bacterium]
MKIDSAIRALAADLLQFIDASPSPWHVVASVRERLLAGDFLELDESQPWILEAGTGYFVVRDASSIIAFKNGEKALSDKGFRIIGAHTDSPGLRIKPNPLIQSGKIDRIGVEVYGGPIVATFTDRDLSVAGRVTLIDAKGELDSRLLNFGKPMLRLPNLAIHMNRLVNEEGLRLHLQNELPLILACGDRPEGNSRRFFDLLGEQLDVEADRITAWDLAVFDSQKGAIYGLDDEFFADSQIDNLASCHAALCALLDTQTRRSATTQVCAFFDHEEIGSQSLKGANGSFLPDVLERIALATDPEPETYKRALAKSFLISADMAHAFQPNFTSAYDPEHPVFVNHGPVIKVNVNQRYASESISQSRFIQLCSEAEVPWQQYSHRSNLPCGSTIGPITSAKLGIRSVDVGCPMWAMHSIRESAGVLDHSYMTRVLTRFFSHARLD